MEKKENFYWVVRADQDGEWSFDEGCHFFRVASVEEAKKKAMDDFEHEMDHGFYELEEGECVRPAELQCGGDAWLEFPHYTKEEEIKEIAIDHGLDWKDVSIFRPGEHPCGNKILVEVSARVFGAVIE